MKFSLDAVKGMDWKQFAIDHGEKIGLGAAALAVAAMLFFGRWTPYTATNPAGIENDVARQARLLSESTLKPDRLKTDAPDFDVASRARAVLQDLSVDQASWVQSVSAPLYPLEAPNGEPTWLPVESLVADAVTLPIRLTDEGAVTVAGAAVDGTDPADAAADDAPDSDFFIPGAGGGGAFGPGDMAGSDGGYGPSSPGFGDRGGFGGDSGDSGSYVPSGPGSGGYGGESSDEFGSGYGGAPAATSNARGKGVKMVAVRGVFPYRRQVQELAKALGVPYAEAKTRLEFLDLEVQRQRAAPGPNPWVEDWEPVDRAAAEALLAEDYSASQGRSPEVVSLAVTDPSITFPLFTRAFGLWDGKDEATHDRIRDFNIGKEDQELERRARARLEELAGEAQQEEAQRGGAQKRSFLGSALDIRGAAAGVAEDSPPAGEAEDPLMAEIRRLSAADVLLLTRFFDVAVEPGQAYRYRMRLVVANPNFGLGEADVSDAAALEGETRRTAWSDPSGVAVVPLDEYVFLASAKAGPAGEPPQAELSVTQFSRQYGTTVSEDVPRVKPGDLLVYEDRKAYVLDPFKMEKDERAPYVFDTDHVVLGVTALPDGAAELHPDLKLGDRSVPNGRAMLLLSTGAVSEVDAGLTPVRDRVLAQVTLLREKLGSQLKDKNAAPPPSADPYGSGGYSPFGGSDSGFFGDED